MIQRKRGNFFFSFFFFKYDDAFVVRGGEVHGGDYPASSQDTTLDN